MMRLSVPDRPTEESVRWQSAGVGYGILSAGVDAREIYVWGPMWHFAEVKSSYRHLLAGRSTENIEYVLLLLPSLILPFAFALLE